MGALAALAAATANHTVGGAVCSADGTQDALPSSACVRGTGQAAHGICMPEDSAPIPGGGAHRHRVRSMPVRTAVQTANDAMYARKLQKTVMKESRIRDNTVRGAGKPRSRARSAHLSSVG